MLSSINFAMFVALALFIVISLVLSLCLKRQIDLVFSLRSIIWNICFKPANLPCNTYYQLGRRWMVGNQLWVSELKKIGQLSIFVIHSDGCKLPTEDALTIRAFAFAISNELKVLVRLSEVTAGSITDDNQYPCVFCCTEKQISVKGWVELVGSGRVTVCIESICGNNGQELNNFDETILSYAVEIVTRFKALGE